MKIAIDISPIIYETGVSTYTSELVKNLLRNDDNNQYLLYGSNLRRFGQLQNITNSLGTKVNKKLYPIPPTVAELLWNKIHFLPIDLLVGKVDVFHSSDWYQPKTNAFK